MRNYKTAAIVLKLRDLSEKDRIATFLSPVIGRFDAVVKGAKKITGKSMGKVEPLNYLQMLLAKGKNLDIVTQTELVTSFPYIRQDLVRTTSSLYMLDMILRNIDEGDKEIRIFKLLKNCLYLIENGVSPQLVNRAFDMKLITLLGYQPVLDNCVLCGASGDFRLVSPEEGGTLCDKCSSSESGAGLSSSSKNLTVSRESLDLLKILRTSDVSKILQIKIPGHILRESQIFLNKYISFNIPDGAVQLKNYEEL
jgi:DNA repair protein RecO (recombination protein O)